MSRFWDRFLRCREEEDIGERGARETDIYYDIYFAQCFCLDGSDFLMKIGKERNFCVRKESCKMGFKYKKY